MSAPQPSQPQPQRQRARTPVVARTTPRPPATTSQSPAEPPRSAGLIILGLIASSIGIPLASRATEPTAGVVGALVALAGAVSLLVGLYRLLHNVDGMAADLRRSADALTMPAVTHGGPAAPSVAATPPPASHA